MPFQIFCKSFAKALNLVSCDSHALELVLFVLQHASSTQETKKIATQLRRDLESKLVQKEIEVVQQSAMLKNIDDFVRLFLEPVCKN